MKINRHNYEEYFILFMDNELSSDGRRMVETFVQNNPDLKNELDILLQSKLAPDNNIVFENKDELLKVSEGKSINQNNYEEWLVLYMDNELSSGEKMEVEKFIALHPEVKTEFEILRKTKFQPEEEIVFPDKESLYHRTEKVRIIQMRWWKSYGYRVAVAAILILAVGITAAVILSNKKTSVTNSGLATSSKKELKTNIENPGLAHKKTNDQTIRPSTTETVRQNTNPAFVKRNNNIVNKTIRDNIPVEVKENEQVMAENKEKTNHLPQPVNTPVNKTELSVNPDKQSTYSQIESNPVTKQEVKTSITQETASVNNPEKTEASFASLDEGSNSKKTRGLFRKAVRFFEKRTKINPADDNDRVMIGGLAIKLN